ncbi:hypothetical protein TBR22_A37760 [Luteitalea sp. TBR-22]|nr:hypothetical protein TBR22_A37760 [Luteitalea sp. TBR-22]
MGVEATIARLAIVGRPALRPVIQRLAQVDDIHRPKLLRVLERMGDPSALPTITPYLSHHDPDVAVAAVDAMGPLLDAPDGDVATTALDALTVTLLDAARPDAVRLRALEAITNAQDTTGQYEADVLVPLRNRLKHDPSEALREAVRPGSAAGPGEGDERSGEALLEAAAAGELPADTEHLRQLLTSHGATAPLTVLSRLVERVRTHEAVVPAEHVNAWRVIRATTHQALAARGSRLAVYDLRETLELLGEQTPVGMLSALQQVGDAAALESVADAWQASADAWFRGQLVTIFRAIAAREKLTRRSAAVKKLAARLPEAFAALWG